MFKSLKITHKLTGAFILIGIVPLLLGIIIMSLVVSRQSEKDSFERLELTLKSKVHQVENWAKDYQKSIEFMTRTEILTTRFDTLKKYHDEKEVKAEAPFPIATEEYNRIWKEISPRMLDIQEQFKVQDLLIICAAHGHVMYSNRRKEDLGTNLAYGKYKDTTLAALWRRVVETKKTGAVDFEQYAPSDNEFASFIAAPFNDADGTMVGVVAVEVSPKRINDIMQNRAGMRTTDESYLVGEVNGKISFRNDLVTMGNGKFVMGTQIHTDYIEKAINGVEGHEFGKDSEGNDVLLVYQPLNIFGFKWAAINKINRQETLAASVRLRNILILILLVIGVLVTLIARFSARTISDPIKKIAAVSYALGEGDLTHQVDLNRGDELGELSLSINQSVEQLGGLVKTVQSASAEITRSSEELSTGSIELAARTNQQAASLTETTATLEEFSAIVKSNNRNSADLKNSMDSFNQVLLANKELVSDVKNTMNQINDSSKRIDAIMNVINDISFQTNLLALNAAVEAARAGEAGRGFAVVANEVRNLAHKTSDSSKTIRDIIGQNVESTQLGIELVNQTDQSITRIVAQMKDLVVKINQINETTHEQATGFDQINTAISQIDVVVNQNAALSEEFSASSEHLKINAEDLLKLVKQFEVR
jgi:methyl-accepting chemotaxis protein